VQSDFADFYWHYTELQFSTTAELLVNYAYDVAAASELPTASYHSLC